MRADIVNQMVDAPSNLCEVSSGTSATPETTEIVHPQAPHAQLLRAVEALRELALSLFNQQSGPTTRGACDMLREACASLR